MAPPKNPGPALPRGWQDTLIAYLERRGTYFKACQAAGVSDETVRRYRHADPVFDARCITARELHADTLEEKLEDEATATGNPVGHIVRLKAIRPDRYIEKHAIMTVNVSTSLPADDGARLLLTMLDHLRPSTRALLETGATHEPQEIRETPETGSRPPALAPGSDDSVPPDASA